MCPKVCNTGWLKKNVMNLFSAVFCIFYLLSFAKNPAKNFWLVLPSRSFQDLKKQANPKVCSCFCLKMTVDRKMAKNTFDYLGPYYYMLIKTFLKSSLKMNHCLFPNQIYWKDLFNKILNNIQFL